MTTTGNAVASSGFALQKIRQIAINVHDPDRAVAFYRDILGLKLLFRAGPLAFFDCDGIRLMLSPPEKAEFDHPSSILYFKVEDIQQAYAELQVRNVTTGGVPTLVARMPDHDLWLAEFRDSEGNVMSLLAEVPR
jgi:catechol 2,3-dioxygenase-like lactoylglutathione lyase family enzyme